MVYPGCLLCVSEGDLQGWLLECHLLGTGTRALAFDLRYESGSLCTLFTRSSFLIFPPFYFRNSFLLFPSVIFRYLLFIFSPNRKAVQVTRDHRNTVCAVMGVSAVACYSWEW